MKVIPYMPLLAVAAMLVIPACGNRYTKDASDTLFSEVKASELNRKYEWFKDAHARLAAYDAQIGSRRVVKPASDEVLLGLIAARNLLAAEYNAEMSKWHTSFANAGLMPEGSSLPKSVINYIQ